MPSFSKESLAVLETCHDDLQRLCLEAIKYYDFKVLEGGRIKEVQEKYFTEGKSKLHWPEGKHCIITLEQAAALGIKPRLKSEAVDLTPVPIDWRPERVSRFFYLAGILHILAIQMGMKIRWGNDWNENQDFYDQKFQDSPHFELREA